MSLTERRGDLTSHSHAPDRWSLGGAPGSPTAERSPKRPSRSGPGATEGAVFTADLPSLTLTYISPSFERVLGYPALDVVGEPGFWEERIALDDRCRVLRQIREAAAEREEIGLEYCLLDAEGGRRSIYAFCAIQRDRDGVARSLVGCMLDITDKVESRRRLQRQAGSQQVLQRIAMIANEEAEPSAALEQALEELCAYTGWPVGHVYMSDPGTGTLVSSGIWHVEDRARYKGFIEESESRSFSSGDGLFGVLTVGSSPFLFENLRPETRFFRSETAMRCGLRGGLVTPVISRDEIVAVLELFTTNEPQDQDPLLEILPAAGLQLGRVIERRRSQQEVEEANRRLLQARDEAEAANRAKSELLSRMSHELRTPLSAILGFAQLLQMDDLEGEQRQSLARIEKAGRHLLYLIDQVLNITRIDTRAFELSIEPVPVAEVLQQVGELLAAAAAEASVGIHISIPQSCRDVHVLADQQKLTEVVGNLTGNAVRYNRRSGEVVVTCERQAGCVEIKVRDTGIGIDPEKLEGLFVPFDRLGAESTPVEGAGLGLATSKRLIEVMGGSLHLQSTSEQGSVFSINLPEAFLSHEQPDLASEIVRPATPDAGPSVKTVLYIEDNPSNLKLVQQLLRRRPDVDLLTATTGGEGFRLAAERLPDLVLLDGHLPDLSGEEVLRRLRADATTAGLRIVIVSADAAPARMEALIAAGADRYLTKPIDLKLFMSLIDEMLPAREPRAKEDA